VGEVGSVVVALDAGVSGEEVEVGDAAGALICAG
jgi:hypothetical protein